MLEEARSLWQSVVTAGDSASPLDRAASWAGLCRYAFERGGASLRPMAGPMPARTGSGRQAPSRGCCTRRTFIASRRTASMLRSSARGGRRPAPDGARVGPGLDRPPARAPWTAGLPLRRERLAVLGRRRRRRQAEARRGRDAERSSWVTSPGRRSGTTGARSRSSRKTRSSGAAKRRPRWPSDRRNPDNRPMRALENVSAAHANLADAYAELGTRLSRARAIRQRSSERLRRRGVAGGGTDRGELLPAGARRVPRDARSGTRRARRR